MAAPEINPANYPSFTDDFEKKGHFGRWNGSITVTGTTLVCTGSNFGVGALLITGTGATGSLEMSNGGTIDLIQLSPKTIYEFGVKSITVSSGTVYLLKRNQRII